MKRANLCNGWKAYKSGMGKIYCSFLSTVGATSGFMIFSFTWFDSFHLGIIDSVCGFTCAGSPCPPADSGASVWTSCLPGRPPCPQSLSSSAPGWLNGWGVSRPNPGFCPAATRRRAWQRMAEQKSADRDGENLNCKPRRLLSFAANLHDLLKSLCQTWRYDRAWLQCLAKTVWSNIFTACV